jgi:hypothetical protein
LISGFQNKHVAFQAVPSAGVLNTLSLKKGQTVICDEVISSVGDGYYPTIGVFTVPVSGVYCFIFTSTPCSDSNDDQCAAHIMLDNEDIGYMNARGRICSTAHAMVYAQAGQRVFPRAYLSDHENKFWTGWLTAFSGVLVQPDV